MAAFLNHEMLRSAEAADTVKRFLGESMKTWRTNLTLNGTSLGMVRIDQMKNFSGGFSVSTAVCYCNGAYGISVEEGKYRVYDAQGRMLEQPPSLHGWPEMVCQEGEGI